MRKYRPNLTSLLALLSLCTHSFHRLVYTGDHYLSMTKKKMLGNGEHRPNVASPPAHLSLSAYSSSLSSLEIHNHCITYTSDSFPSITKKEINRQ